MKHFLLFYEADGDYAERRKPFRAAHLAHARAAKDRGELVLAGGLAEPVDGSVLLFKGETDGARAVSPRLIPISSTASFSVGACANGPRWWATSR